MDADLGDPRPPLNIHLCERADHKRESKCHDCWQYLLRPEEPNDIRLESCDEGI